MGDDSRGRVGGPVLEITIIKDAKSRWGAGRALLSLSGQAPSRLSEG